MFERIIEYIIVGIISGLVSGKLVIDKTIPKNKEPKLDRDMEILLEKNGYRRLK